MFVYTLSIFQNTVLNFQCSFREPMDPNTKSPTLLGGAQFGKDTSPVIYGVHVIPLMILEFMCLLQHCLGYCVLWWTNTSLCGEAIFGKDVGPVTCGVPLLPLMKPSWSLHHYLLYVVRFLCETALCGGANFGKDWGPAIRGVLFLPLMKLKGICWL